jgi:biotin carboxyl carrier protein
MKQEFTLTLANIEYPVIAEGDTITVNGRSFAVEITDDGMVLVDGIAYDVALEDETAIIGEESYSVRVTGLAMTAGVPSVAPSDLAAAPVTDAGAGAVLAIMPGKIVRMMVEVGQQVEEGEPVCVLEAMKMENELNAGQSGVVRAVHVNPGNDVEKDQVLVEIE